MAGAIFLMMAVVLCVLGTISFPQIVSNGDFMSVIYFVLAVPLAFFAYAEFRLRPYSDNDDSAGDQTTHMAELHSEKRCDSEGCGFEVWDRLGAVKSAEAHHRETGHVVFGTRGYEVWVGSEVPSVDVEGGKGS